MPDEDGGDLAVAGTRQGIVGTTAGVFTIDG